MNQHDSEHCLTCQAIRNPKWKYALTSNDKVCMEWRKDWVLTFVRIRYDLFLHDLRDIIQTIRLYKDREDECIVWSSYVDVLELHAVSRREFVPRSFLKSLMKEEPNVNEQPLGSVFSSMMKDPLESPEWISFLQHILKQQDTCDRETEYLHVMIVGGYYPHVALPSNAYHSSKLGLMYLEKINIHHRPVYHDIKQSIQQTLNKAPLLQ